MVSVARFREMLCATLPTGRGWFATLTSAIANVSERSFVLRQNRQVGEFVRNPLCAPHVSYYSTEAR